MVHRGLYLLLSYSALLMVTLPVTSQNMTQRITPRLPSGPPANCTNDICWPISSNGWGVEGEPTTGHIAPDCNNVYLAVDKTENPHPGDIIVRKVEDVPKIPSAIIRSFIFPSTWLGQGLQFVRYIHESHKGTLIGILVVMRPVPDPDTRVASLLNNSLLAGVPTGIRSELDLASLIPSPTVGCKSNGCIAVYPFVDLFYFGPKPTNTACLSAIKVSLPTPLRPNVTMNPHSVYLVYQPIQFFDLCRNWLGGRIGPPETSRLDPGSLSTLERRPNAAQATKSFDLADLPCPPSAIAAEYDSTVSYTPIYPRDNLTGYEYAPDGVRVPFSNYMVTIENRGSPDRITIPSFSNNTCEMTAIRDPPVYGVRVGEITGPKDGGGPIP